MEYVLLNKKDAKVFKVPPATSASGHKAGDWGDAIWVGNVRLVGRGKDLYIKLLERSGGNLFAQCVIPNGEHEKYCEKVTDSSRYWVLKVVNGQRHAFLGFGFSDRNDAFDFTCCLQDFKSTFVDKDKEAEANAAALEAPMKDMSLKEGETFKVNIAALEGGSRRQRPAESSSGGGLFKLAPPPPAGGVQAVVPTLAAPPAPAAAVQEDFADFGDFGDFASAPA